MAIIKLNNNSLTSVTALPSGVGADPNVKLDVARLGLRTFANQNLAKQNSNSMSYDVFQDATGLESSGVGTNASRNANEYVSSTVFAEGTLTINNSNYTTYIDSVKGVQASSSLRPSGSNELTAITNFDTVTDNSSYTGTNSGGTTNSAHLGTKGAYLFGSNGDSDTSYWLANNNVAGAAASNYYWHTILLKLNISALNDEGFAIRDYSMKWRNGAGNWWWNQMYGSIDTTGINTQDEDHQSLTLKSGSGISNGTTYTASVDGTDRPTTVSYTHLTLPTNREV